MASVVSFILLFVIGLKFWGIVWLRGHGLLGASTPHTFIGDDYPRAWQIKWPERDVLLPIHDTVRYQLATEDGAAEWAASTPGDGIIYLGEQCRPFSISMFHQIRCLDTLRTAFVNANTTRLETPEETGLTRHCLNYLRQMVFCRSHPYLDDVRGFPKPNAYPDLDRCRDWDTVYTEVRRNHQRCGK
ncbi:hypothetical protein C8J57DRAFT_697333 [Mycena rebaudengoi]|nr:hypothetical protein C8J57DRAFT_697333 [Mycena rebaudengoi]